MSSSASRQSVLMLIVLAVVSIAAIVGIAVAVRHFWSQVSGSFAGETRLAQADKKWDEGQKSEAVETYKKMLALEDNPVLGVPIDEKDRPRLYQRIIESELARDEHEAALEFARKVGEYGMIDTVLERMDSEEGKQLLRTVDHGRKLHALLIMIVEASQKPPAKEAPEPVRKKYEEQLRPLIEEFDQVPFDPTVSPAYTRWLQQLLREHLRQIQDETAAAHVRSRLQQISPAKTK